MTIFDIVNELPFVKKLLTNDYNNCIKNATIKQTKIIVEIITNAKLFAKTEEENKNLSKSIKLIKYFNNKKKLKHKKLISIFLKYKKELKIIIFLIYSRLTTETMIDVCN